MEEISEIVVEENQHFNSIALDVHEEQIIRKSINVSIKLSIENFQIIEGRIKSHVSYKISGEENSSQFEISRRYKEFRTFCKVLSVTWPGCVIPKIPPKKAVGNLKTSFIEKRKKLLEMFLVKVSSQGYFCNSEAFNTFLHDSQDFIKAEKDVKIPTLPEILTRYREIFAEFTYFEPNLQHKNDLKEHLIEFQEIHTILKKVKKAVKQSVLSFDRYEESLLPFYSALKTITPLIIKNKDLNVNAKERFTNPYTTLREWLRADILDLEAIIEAINKIFTLDDDVKNFESKIEKKKKHLEALQSGKKSIGQRLFSKPQEAMVSEDEKSIEDLEKNKDALEKILAISVGKMLQSDVPKFKQQKIYRISDGMRSYSNGLVQEYQEIAEMVLQIEGSLNS